MDAGRHEHGHAREELLELPEDIYSAGFVHFHSGDSAIEADRIVLKCLLAFVFQVSLFTLLIWYRVQGTAGSYKSIKYDDWTLNGTRLLCAYLLHIMVMPKITLAMDMMQYITQEPTKFRENGVAWPIWLSLFKFTGGVFAMLANLIIILSRDSIERAVMDFISVSIIREIDALLTPTLVSYKIRQRLSIEIRRDPKL